MIDPLDFGYTPHMGYGRCALIPLIAKKMGGIYCKSCELYPPGGSRCRHCPHQIKIKKEKKRTCGKCWRFRIYMEGDLCRRNGSYAYFKDMNPGDTPCNSFEWKYPYSPEGLYHYTECGECGELYQTGGLWHKCKPEKLNKEEKNMGKKEIRNLTKQVKILKGKLDDHIDRSRQYIGIVGEPTFRQERPWPVKGDYYYYISADMVHMTMWLDYETDKRYLKDGNVFKHRHEAEKKIMGMVQKDEAIIKEFAEKLEEQEKSFPVDGGIYWCIMEDGEIKRMIWCDDSVDNRMLSAGNVFESHAEAERELNRRKLSYRMRQAAGEAWKAGPTCHTRWFFWVDRESKRIEERRDHEKVTIPGVVYFPTKKYLFEFIGKNRELIDKIYHTKKYKSDYDELTITFE